MEYLSKEKLKHYFPIIYNDLIKTYPMSLKNNSKEYQEYPGIKKLNSLVTTNIINNENHSAFWVKNFCDKLSIYLNQKVIGATFGVKPSYAAQIILNNSKDNPFQSVAYLYVSLVAKYFSVEIIEFDKKKHEAIGLNTENLFVYSVKNVFVSPQGKYEKLFRQIESFIRKEFLEFKFLPAKFDHIYVKGLSVLQNDFSDNPISTGFLGKIQKDTDTVFLGDLNYGGF